MLHLFRNSSQSSAVSSQCEHGIKLSGGSVSICLCCSECGQLRPQITAEVQQLIEETAAAFREYQQTRAEVGRHLAAAERSTDALARPLSPLPALPDGPDEVRRALECDLWMCSLCRLCCRHHPSEPASATAAEQELAAWQKPLHHDMACPSCRRSASGSWRRLPRRQRRWRLSARPLWYVALSQPLAVHIVASSEVCRLRHSDFATKGHRSSLVQASSESAADDHRRQIGTTPPSWRPGSRSWQPWRRRPRGCPAARPLRWSTRRAFARRQSGERTKWTFQDALIARFTLSEHTLRPACCCCSHLHAAAGACVIANASL